MIHINGYEHYHGCDPIDMPLEGLIKKGQYITFRGAKWRVKRKDVYSVSAAYRETQWTLSNRGGNTAYLLRTEEKQDSEEKEYWTWTKQVSLTSVEFQPDWKEWSPFDENSFPKAIPPRIRYDGTEYRFKLKNVGEMRSSDGDITSKTTWDYLDGSGKRNLAIEIWKEEDRDCPEAYDGEIIDPAELQVASGRPVSSNLRPKPLLELYRADPAFSLANMLCVILIPALFFFFIGSGLDTVLYPALPALLMGTLLRSYTLPACRICFIAGIACTVPTFFVGLTSFWIICAVCVFLSVLIPPVLVRKYDIAEDERLTFVAWSGVLPVVWLYSFSVYFDYAPKPFEVYELVMTCMVPLIISILSFGSILLTERMWRNRD